MVSAASLPKVEVIGPWERLHRAESNTLAALLTAREQEAVHRRLGIPTPALPAWIPVTAGEQGGRFAEPHGPGVLYLGNDLATCLKEVAHHHARICAASVGTPPGARAVFRHLIFRVAGTLADAASLHGDGLHDPASYAPSWRFARLARAAALEGVHYRSVRRRGGRCLAVFEPRTARFLRVEFGAVVLEWDGSASQRIA